MTEEIRNDLNESIKVLDSFAEKIYNVKTTLEWGVDAEEDEYSEVCDLLNQAHNYLEDVEDKINDVIKSIKEAIE